MQSASGPPNENKNDGQPSIPNGLWNSQQSYNEILTSSFPAGSSRAAGLATQNQPQSGHLASISQEELERHQRSSNGPVEDDIWRHTRQGVFPVPGGRPPFVPADREKSFQIYQSYTAGHNPSNTSSPQIRQQQQRHSLPNEAPSSSSHYPQIRSDQPDSVSSFLAEMPTNAEDPTRHVLWSELIRLKTTTLELQIAEARRKEREAELEIMRLKAGAAAKSDPSESVSRTAEGNVTSGHHGMGLQQGAGSSTNHDINAYQQFASTQDQQFRPQHQQQQQQQIAVPQSHTQQLSTIPTLDQRVSNSPMDFFGSGQTTMTPFDLEAMLQSDNLDNMLSWLPDLGDGSLQEVLPLAPTTDFDYVSSTMPFSIDSADPVLRAQILTATPSRAARDLPPPTGSSPVKQRRSPSPAESNSPREPPTKKTKKGTEKKVVVEQSPSCVTCHRTLARIMFRAPKTQIPTPITITLQCPSCLPVDQPSTVPDQGPSNSGSSIGTVETRKRMRVSMEIDDEEAKVKDRRTWCDVCQRIVGSGQIIGGKEKESLTWMSEIICSACDSKYQRCTDCGGGGGPRVGIGKWRMKQVFHPGRKTCCLSHTRLGDRTRELGVHVTPTDFTPEQIKEVLTRCKALWNEKTLSRLAVPEMLEVDLPPGLANPLRDYADVDDMVTRNWPSREAMIVADGLDPNRFKRLLSLIWSHSKPRRTVRTVDLEEEWSRQAEDNDDDLSTVLDNVKRTNVVIPPGSELIGMWGGEWDMQNGSLLISTFIPFEGADGEDSTALSVGEMISKVQALQQEINIERTAQAKKEGKEPELLPPCAHLWTVSGGYIPLVRERFADILIRKRSFVHVEEYLTRHPEFIECIKARPVGLHPDIVRSLPSPGISSTSNPNNPTDQNQQAKPLILVRWLGNEFDTQKILEIKRMEFGRKKKRTKSKP